MSRSSHSRKLVQTVRQLVRAGVRSEPKWLQALEKCPPFPLEKGKKPKPIVYPEDRYIQSFYDRYPQARQEPLDLQGPEPPLARRFALRQLELVEGGTSPREARQIVDDELQALGVLNTTGPTAQSTIGSVQYDEEMSLQGAMTMALTKS